MAMELKHLNPQHVIDVSGKAIDEISRLRAENAELNAENERLKEMMPEYEQFIKDEDFKKKLVDEYAGYVYEWAGHRYVATPYINLFIKGILRALWLSRANRALEKIAWFKLMNASISTMNPEDGARQEFDKWKKALGKFLKKAEEYK